jgi:hypothetical protein
MTEQDIRRFKNIGLIQEAKIDEEIILEHHYIYKVKFTLERLSQNEEKYSAGDYYLWIAYSINQKWNSIYPMLTYGIGGYVKLFKTLSGAKRNFIKRYLKEEN